jgi:Iodothyronine deiodinase
MAREYSNKGFVFLFLYIREAHPAENFPAHRSTEQKLAHARTFKDRFQIERPILVDDLVGTAHKLYGLLPNMTYIIGRGGKILFRADWTDPPTIEWAVRYIQDSRARRREGLQLAPFYAEIAGYRWNSPAKVMEGLVRAGPKAVEDYKKRAMQRKQNQGPTPGRIEIDE